MAAGSTFYISLNGRRFATPEDLDPAVTIGGLTNKEALRNGDGSVDPQQTKAPGSVKGLSVRIRNNNGDLEALNRISSQEGVTLVCSCVAGVYSGTGFLAVGDEGIKMSQSEGKTEDFDFFISSGSPLEVK